MTPKERCMAVLNGEIPDVLPVVPQSFMYALETAGLRNLDVNWDGTKMAYAHQLSQEKYQYDACIIDFDDATIAEAIGAEVIFRDDAPAVVDESKPVLKNLRDVYDLDIPDPQSAGRMPVWLEATKTLVDSIGNDVMVMGRADQGPFSVACLLRGTTQFMMDLILEDKQVIKDVIDYCRRVIAVFAKAQKDAGAHITSIGDALAGPNLISPDMYREFAYEPEKQLINEVQDYGIPMSLHICGNTNDIIADMGRTGARLIEVDWKLDMENARKAVPDSTVLMGNIDPSFPLVLGTPDDIDASVKNLIDKTKGRGLFISSGCAMGKNTPEDNFRAFIAASRKYGSIDYISKL